MEIDTSSSNFTNLNPNGKETNLPTLDIYYFLDLHLRFVYYQENIGSRLVVI
jgi:hypothetical protein